ncbi:MAG: thiamine pyrophosphate-dependent enzyme [Candidatus Poribacteria bacterium]|nr:thiamine pyrophosphate-dependent enzyme [Candidatus Poribacteria bacterium]
MDRRFIQESGSNVYTGCELLIKGALESGVSLLTGYPGSPLADVFEVIRRNADLLKEHGIVAQIANNEALSVARLNGSQMANLRAVAYMKSVGLHVASDALAISNLAGTTGGAVVVVGDDPASSSTQVPADSRFIARHLYTPVVEPSTFQEVKDWLRVAFELSVNSNLYTAYLVTVNQADGGGNVQLHPNRYPDINANDTTTLNTDDINIDNRVVLPPDSARIEIETLERRFPNAIETARRCNLNQIYNLNGTQHEMGFITSGVAYTYLEHALHELEIQGQIPILKLGLTHPVDTEIVRQFSASVREIYVVEEKRPLLEKDIKAIIGGLYQSGEIDRYVQVWGKQFPNDLPGIPESLGLNPSILIQRLIPLLRRKMRTDSALPSKGLQGREESTPVKIHMVEGALSREEKRIEQVNSYDVQIPARTPTFCPGCPHRDSSSVFLDITKHFMDADYMKKQHASPPVDLVFHGDIGCYSMLKYEPFPRLMHNLSAMALGGGTGAGIDSFIKNKQIVFMGDSTFFHGGMSAISDSIKNGQDITYVILDNQTTAMTGHQPTPAGEEDILGNPTFAQDIEKVARGLAGGSSNLFIVRTDPEDRVKYKALLEDTILNPGVKIVIADKECGITYHRRLRRENHKTIKEKGFLKVEKHINITPEVCEFCLECTKATGCPGLKVNETDYGPKIGIDSSNCVTDGACARIKWACPSFEEVIVTRKRPPKVLVDADLDLRTHEEEMPMGVAPTAVEPMPLSSLCDFNRTWSVYAAGVGGMGIGTISSILVLAGYAQGYQVRFCDKKGLAIRNGGVYAHVTYSKTDNQISPIIPYGKANLLLGLDILEAVRGIDAKAPFRVAAPDLTAAIVNTAKTDTVTTLIGKDSFEIADLENSIRAYTITDEYFGANLFEVSERLLGNNLYANIMLLGVAFQRGQLPLELDHIQSALTWVAKPSDLASNQRAFDIGRRIAIDADAFAVAPKRQGYKSLLRQKCEILEKRWRGEGLAGEYEKLVQEAVEAMGLDEKTNRGLALRVYDLIQFEDLNYARRYTEKIRHIYAKDRRTEGFRATKSAINNLYKVMLIKDEIYVAHLLTSEDKLKRDKAQYNVDEANGDKIKYVHLNRPHFTVMGKDIRWDMNTRNWQLNLMKRMKFLRRWLSQWHAKEKVFRDWYIVEVVDTFAPKDANDYDAHVRALQVPQDVCGYREVRYPKMETAKHKAEALLSKIRN